MRERGDSRGDVIGPALLASTALTAGIVAMLLMATGLDPSALPLPKGLLFLIGGVFGLAPIHAVRD